MFFLKVKCRGAEYYDLQLVKVIYSLYFRVAAPSAKKAITLGTTVPPATPAIFLAPKGY